MLDPPAAEVLAAGGSAWSALAPMGARRRGLAAAVASCGEVLVAGGWEAIHDPEESCFTWKFKTVHFRLLPAVGG